MSDRLNLLLSKLSKVKSLPSKDGRALWQACCPAHDDKTPSLSISFDDNEKIGIHCFAGCNAGNIMSAVGMAVKDLYPPLSAEQKALYAKLYQSTTKQQELDGKILRHNMGVAALEQGIVLSPKDAELVLQADEYIQAVRKTDIDPVAYKIKQLAELSPMEYDKVRKDAAALLGVRTSTLDAEVKAKKPTTPEDDQGGRAMDFDLPEAWPDPVNTDTLLNELVSSLKNCITLRDDHSAIAIALWVLYSYPVTEHGHIAPMLLITSPEKRCGKSTLLAWCSKVVYKPLPTSSISPSAVFRSVDKWSPTLLIDEIDAFLGQNDELRGILNSGHTRDSAFTIRCVGDDLEPRKFSTWGPKILSGIGRLEGKTSTLADRSIEIQLRRKLPSEKIEKLRHIPPSHFETLRSKCTRFCQDYGTIISKSRPHIPEALSDRAADNWEPLLAIADLAGEAWPQKAMNAALALSGVEESVQDRGPELLSHLRQYFTEHNLDCSPTVDIINYLIGIDDAPWATWSKGKPMTPRHLSSLLKPYKVTKTHFRDGKSDYKGYYLKDFKDAFSRYLPSVTRDEPDFDISIGHTVTTVAALSVDANSLSVTQSECDRNEIAIEPYSHNECDRVTDREPIFADTEDFSDWSDNDMASYVGATMVEGGRNNLQHNYGEVTSSTVELNPTMDKPVDSSQPEPKKMCSNCQYGIAATTEMLNCWYSCQKGKDAKENDRGGWGMKPTTCSLWQPLAVAA